MEGNKNENGCEINSLLLPKPQNATDIFSHTIQVRFKHCKLDSLETSLLEINSTIEPVQAGTTIRHWCLEPRLNLHNYLKNRTNTICTSDRKYTVIVQLLTVASLHGSFILPSQYQIFPLVFWRVMINSKRLSKNTGGFLSSSSLRLYLSR